MSNEHYPLEICYGEGFIGMCMLRICLSAWIGFASATIVAQAPPPLPPSLRGAPDRGERAPAAPTASDIEVGGDGKVQSDAAAPIHPPELMLDLGTVLGEIRDLCFSPDGRHLAIAGDRLARVFEVESGQLVASLRGDRSRGAYGRIHTLSYSPDGQFLLIGIADHHRRGSIRVYRTDNLETLDRLLPGLTAPCRHVQFSHDGSRLVACDDDGEIVVYDWPQTLRTVRPKILVRIAGRGEDSRIIDQLQFTEDRETILAIESDGPHAYRSDSGAELTHADQFTPRLLGWFDDIAQQRIQWPMGQNREPRVFEFDFFRNRWAAAWFVTNREGTRHWAAVYSARPWRPNLPLLAPTSIYSGHRWAINTVCLSPVGDLAASGDKFGEVHLWKVSDGQPVRVIRSPGTPIYAAAIDVSGERIAFTRQPDLSTWGINQYGNLSQVVDLRERVVRDIDSLDHFEPLREVRADGPDHLTHRRLSGSERTLLQRVRNGQVQASYQIPSGKLLSAYTFAGSPGPPVVGQSPPADQILGTTRPVLFGDQEGFLGCWDANNDELRRAFRGHENMITSISVSASKHIFLTASTDKTIRIWSLRDYDPSGIFDFRYESNAVYRVDPGTDSARAGVKIGDRLVRVGGMKLTEFYDRLLSGERVFDQNQQVEVEMRRADQVYRYPMRLRRGFDYVEPLLNLFVRDDQTWIIWTPEWYYDCSPGADSLIGWHINHGPDRAAEFFHAEQFRELMYRPDIVRRVLSVGVFGEAIAQLESEPERRPIVRAFQTAEQFARVRPPTVRAVAPKTGTTPQDDRITAEAVIEADGDMPISEVTLLVNGSPAKVFRPGTADDQQRMVVSHRVKLGPGRNTIAWIAGNAVASSNPNEAVAVVRGPDISEKPNLVALIIGVNEYQHAGDGFSNLRHAVNDAEQFRNALKRHFEGKLYNHVETRLLTDAQATRAGVLDALSWWTDSASEGDTVVLFCSMHGFIDERERFYLAGHDAEQQRLRATGIAWDIVTDALHQDLPHCRRFVFIDACHAGGVSNITRSPLNGLSDAKLGVTFFASCEISQRSIERDEWKHGAFTKSLLASLSDSAADNSPQTGDGLLDITELTTYIRDQVLGLTGRRQKPVTFAGNRIPSDPVFESFVDDDS